MARRSRNQAPLPLDRPAPVALTDEQVVERSKRLCQLRATVRSIKREIKDLTKSKQDEITGHEATMLELETQIVEGMEARAQSTLRYGEGEDAKQVLAKVAEKAGEPRPSEPHAFEGTKGKPFECVTCGSSPTDPVHELTAAATAGGDNGSGKKAATNLHAVRKRGPQTSAKAARS